MKEFVKNLDMLIDFERNASLDTFRLLFGEARYVDMFTKFQCNCDFSVLKFLSKLRENDLQKIYDLISKEQIVI